jgi:hypothetical protein
MKRRYIVWTTDSFVNKPQINKQFYIKKNNFVINWRDKDL